MEEARQLLADFDAEEQLAKRAKRLEHAFSKTLRVLADHRFVLLPDSPKPISCALEVVRALPGDPSQFQSPGRLMPFPRPRPDIPELGPAPQGHPEPAPPLHLLSIPAVPVVMARMP